MTPQQQARSNWQTDQRLRRHKEFEVLLRQQSGTIEELRNALGVSRPTLDKILTAHRGSTHISGWVGYAPVWSWGAGEDLPRPATLTFAANTGRGCYKPQPVRRDASVSMLFGEARA
jgi:hypothetical protein